MEKRGWNSRVCRVKRFRLVGLEPTTPLLLSQYQSKQAWGREFIFSDLLRHSQASVVIRLWCACVPWMHTQEKGPLRVHWLISRVSVQCVSVGPRLRSSLTSISWAFPSLSCRCCLWMRLTFLLHFWTWFRILLHSLPPPPLVSL